MVSFKQSIISAAVLAPLLLSTAASARAVSSKKNTVVTVSKVEVVTYPIEVTGYFAANGTYPVDAGYTLTVSNAPTSIDLKTHATSTTTTTSTTTVKGHVANTSTTSTRYTVSTTATQSVSGTKTSSAGIPTKTGVTNCNVQGTAAGMTIRNKPATANSVLDCQTLCFSDSPCETYSYDPTTKICTGYMSQLDVSSGKSGVFFSAKYPGDGSNYCYGTTGY